MTTTRVPRDLARQNGFSRDVLAAYREAVRRYGSKLWVTGISISLKEVAGELDTGLGPVIAIHVRKKQKNARIPPASRIPRKILGIPTDVIEGTYTPSSNGVAASASPVFPLRPGSSYARNNGTAALTVANSPDGCAKQWKAVGAIKTGKAIFWPKREIERSRRLTSTSTR